MNIINLIQGTPEWHAHRANHFNASDAPAMLGISKYKSRAKLLHEMATGITEDIDAATQRRFDDGHRFEALARPRAEIIVGDDLYPVVGSEGKLSASFDGLTMDNKICFEHKTINDSLRNALSGSSNALCESLSGELPEQYRAQMEQQLMLSSAERCLFMASHFDENDVLEEELHCWYTSDQDMRERIMHGWTQFAIDLEEYKRKLAAGEIEQPKATPKAEAIQALPSVFVQATSMVTASNLSEFKESATTFIAAIKTELASDQDFADAEATVKFCKDAEVNLEATKASVLAQMSSVDEVVRTLDHIAAQLRDKRLMLDKLVKSEKEARKLAIVRKAANDYTSYIDALEAETKPIRLNVNGPSFAEAIKGLKSLASMQEKVDTALRDAKFAADTAAKDVRAKLAWCKTNAAGMSALFPDLQALMAKPMEDFTLTITSRIEKQKADEAARLETERARMEAEAKAKAEAEAAAKLKADEERIRAEERAKAEAEAQAQAKLEAEARAKAHPQVELGTRMPLLQDHDNRTALVQKESAAAAPVKSVRPSRKELILMLADGFDVSEQTALDWILSEFAGDIQFNNMKQAA